MRPAELHSPSAEENCMTENVASLRSVKVATPPCAAYAAIPCGLAVRKQHKMLFAASNINCINIYQSNGEQERVIYMKKMFTLLMAIMLCFALTACSEKVSIDFPFELSSVENVEMFRFINPVDAEKKVITKSEDIEEIYQTFESVSLKDKTTEPTAGGSVTSFRFNLSDGTSYEVIYSEVAVKAGRVITTGMEQDFFTSADIGAFWESYDYEVTTASEDELPALYE